MKRSGLYRFAPACLLALTACGSSEDKLAALGPDLTRVRCRESMDGFLLGHFYSSAELQTSIDRWMGDLKTTADANPPPMASVAAKSR